MMVKKKVSGRLPDCGVDVTNEDAKKIIRDNLATHYGTDPDTIRLLQIIDRIDAADERGLPSVSLDIDDARWLVSQVGNVLRPPDPEQAA